MSFCRKVLLLTLMCAGLSVISGSASAYRRSQSTTPFPVDKRCDLNEKCVVYYLCKSTGDINTDAEYLIDERMDVASSNAVMCPTLQRCCKENGIEKTNKTEHVSTTKYPRRASTKTTKNPNSSDDTSSGETTTKEPASPCNSDSCESTEITPPSINQQSKCGYRNLKGLVSTEGKKTVESIQGNTDYAQYGEFPWMVAVLRVKPAGTGWLFVLKSGGSLIHPKVVLTSAHNVAEDEAEDLKVRAGEWNTQTEDEKYKHEERHVASIIRHESFTRQNLQNDLALLVMKSEFPMNSLINTICLPPPNTSFDQKRCFVSGWGKDFFGKSGSYQAFLKKVDLPIVSHNTCQVQLRKTRYGPDFELHDGFLCAGGEEGKDACTGDGGSPLMCSIKSNPDHYYLAGIVVGSIGCGHKNVPALYVQVSNYREWIDQQMRGLKLQTSRYEF